MKGLFFTLMVLQASWTVTALRCNDYSCNNGRCFKRGNTCETSTGSCKTRKSISDLVGSAEMFKCSDMSGMQCTSELSNTSGTIVASECCNTDLCNDGNSKPPFEDGQSYCYSASCDFEGCLEEMIRYIDQEPIWAFCKADENGCQTSKQVYGRIVQAKTGCARSTCFPTTQSTPEIKMTVTCCTGHMCNKADNSEPESGGDLCYDYACQSLQSPGHCLSVQEAIRQNKTYFCEKTEKGCFTSSVTSESMTIITSGCVGKSPGMDKCIPASIVGDRNIIVTCCNSDRCNSGTSSKDSALEPQKKYCHVYMCRSSASSPCVSLTTAIEQHKTTVCEMKDNAGCMYMKSGDSNSKIIISNCLGTTDSPNMCMHYGSWDSDRIIRCCSEDRCNPEKLQSDRELSTAYAFHSIDVRNLLLLSVMAMVTVLGKVA